LPAVRRLLIVLLVAAGLGAATLPAAIAAGDYSDSAYAQHDLDNITRSAGRHRDDMVSPRWHQAMQQATAESYLAALGIQLSDLGNGRIHTGLGQWIPGGSVGDPLTYNGIPSRRVQFLSRTGARLSGHIWGSEGSTPKPGIVITTGSIQATEGMYWWIAEVLARAGYQVMTFDVQGQGESEGFGHGPGDKTPTLDGVPAQQTPVFVDGTIDALRFFLSTPEHPYRPVGWTEADAGKAAAGRGPSEQIDWYNPGFGTVDRDHIGIAGHSLGATAVSIVQQCSDMGATWKKTPDCHGQSYPIRAVIGWDALTSTVTPVVPGMNEQADGYFLNPEPSPQAPDPATHLAANNAWTKAGLDTYSFTVRGGTHLEWSYIPFISMATSYGRQQIAYYTLAWFDKWVFPSAARNADALMRLLEGPRQAHVPTEAPWVSDYFSARYFGGFRLTVKGKVVSTTDIRAYGGASKVGDWAGANADRQGRVIP